MPATLRRAALFAWVLLTPAVIAAQLGSRPAEEWVKTLDGPARVASLRIDEVVAALSLSPGQTVADVGAGSGLLAVPMAKAVGPTGRVYAVEIDAGFFPVITKRAAEAKVVNVQTVLGSFTDPKLPTKAIDLALFHDVLHHIQNREEYLTTLAKYLGANGRIAVVDFEGGQGPHAKQPELQVPRAQLTTWMQKLGLELVHDVKLFADKYVLVFRKR
jgi:ubiquinone/menaquinone biosynthesis C-methylase UbiE